MALSLSSSAFAHQGAIPAKYTCAGSDTAPPLAWSGAPEGTRSFVLIVDDPDAPDPRAPRMTWVHWLVYNLPADSSALGEAGDHHLPAGALQGVNDWKRADYGGPCPPIGRHRYFFKLYALDTQLADLHKPNKEKLLRAMEGHVLEQSEMVGLFEK